MEVLLCSALLFKSNFA